MKIPHRFGGILGLAMLVILCLPACQSPKEAAREALLRDGVALERESYLDAINAGDEKLVRRLLEAKVRIQVRDEHGRTPLMLAVLSRQPEIANLLIKEGAFLGSVDEEGGSVLFHAVASGDEAMVKKVLGSGMSPNEIVPEGGTLVAYALDHGHFESARMMFEAGGSYTGRGSDGTPLVFHALRPEFEGILEKAFAAGVSPNVFREGKQTLLHETAKEGKLEMMEQLLAAGAEVDAENEAGKTGLALAVLHDHRGLFSLLLEAGANPNVQVKHRQSALEVVLAREDLVSASLLLKENVVVGDALYKAVLEKNVAKVDLLLDYGVDPNPKREDPPLLAAVRMGEATIVSSLIRAGASDSAVGTEGQVALNLAVAKGQTELVKQLLEMGADPNAPFAQPVKAEFMEQVTSDGYIKWQLQHDQRIYPLMMAADAGNVAMIQVLMESGAKTDVYTRKHRHWPIGFAARRSDVRAMKALLGVNPDEDERLVKVDLSEQMARVYDSAGNTIFTTPVSTGKKGYRTKTGEFVITNKYRRWTSTLYDSEMPYFQRLSCGDFGFHSGYVPGHPASHGCIRVPSGNAERLYRLTRYGDRVVIVQ